MSRRTKSVIVIVTTAVLVTLVKTAITFGANAYMEHQDVQAPVSAQQFTSSDTPHTAPAPAAQDPAPALSPAAQTVEIPTDTYLVQEGSVEVGVTVSIGAFDPAGTLPFAPNADSVHSALVYDLGGHAYQTASDVRTAVDHIFRTRFGSAVHVVSYTTLVVHRAGGVWGS